MNCTNNLAEFTTVWSLLIWACHRQIKELRIFGDSLLVIEWLQGKSAIKAFHLAYRCSKILALTKLFDQVQFEHIHREFNMEADYLSKKGLGCTEGSIQIEEIKDGIHRGSSSLRIF